MVLAELAGGTFSDICNTGRYYHRWHKLFTMFGQNNWHGDLSACANNITFSFVHFVCFLKYCASIIISFKTSCLILIGKG